MNEHEVTDEVATARLLDAVGQAVIVTDRGGIIRHWNATAETLFGWSGDEVVGRSVLEVTPVERATEDAAAIMATLRTGQSWSGEMVLRRRSGEAFVARVTDTPVLDASGEVVAIVGVSEDITARDRLEQERRRLLAEESAARATADAALDRLEFLSTATGAMANTADVDERLARLARVGVPRFADGCAVHLLGDDGQAYLAALHHVDPEHLDRLRSLIDRYPVRLEAPVGAGAAIREGRVSWLPEIDEELLRSVARDEVHLSTLRALHISTAVSVPLRGRAGSIGAATFYSVGQRRLSHDDVRLARELCDRAGVLIENAQLIAQHRRSEAEQRYQAALLEALFEASVDGLLVVDKQGRVLSYNRRFVQMWGMAPEVLEQGHDEALLAAAVTKVVDPDAFLQRVRERYAARTADAHDEVLLRDGRVFDRHGAPLHGDGGEYLGWAWSFRDITQVKRQQAETVAEGERSAALARTLQQSLLPPRLPAPTGIELAAHYHPALEGVEVGGDFYDVFAAESDWVLVIGDVCGKGPHAAALTALIRYTVRASAMHTPDPAGMLTELNAAMPSEGDEHADARFATVCCVRLRAHPGGGATAHIACAGHPQPFLLRADGVVETVGAPGTLVGLLDEVDITTVSVALDPGDSIVMVTDGVIEARDEEGAELERSGVAALLADRQGQPASAISEAVERRALAFQGGHARDDIAVLVARVLPAV